jgi:hypothetical protein
LISVAAAEALMLLIAHSVRVNDESSQIGSVSVAITGAVFATTIH